MRKKVGIFLAVVLLILTAAIGRIVGVRFIQYKNAQQARINLLEDRINALTDELDATDDQLHLANGRVVELTEQLDPIKKAGQSETGRAESEPDTVYNWLAIGNSLTLIEAYGHGICSTEADNDYFGLVKAYLEEEYPAVNTSRCHFGAWEMSSDRDEALLDYIDEYLSPSLDLVTVQLGENVYDTDTFEEDLILLIEHIQNACPRAQIIVVDNFWYPEHSEAQKAAAEETQSEFADLSEIRGDPKYQSREGTEFRHADGTVGIVSKDAETHPNDDGMNYIANRIIEQIRD